MSKSISDTLKDMYEEKINNRTKEKYSLDNLLEEADEDEDEEELEESDDEYDTDDDTVDESEDYDDDDDLDEDYDDDDDLDEENDDEEELDEEDDEEELDEEDDEEELDEEDEDDDDIEEAHEPMDASGKGSFDSQGKGFKVNDPVNADDAKNKKSVASKSSSGLDKKGVPEVKPKGGDQSKEMKEQLNKLFAGKRVSKRLAEDVITIFEAEVARRVAEVSDHLEERYAEILANNIEDLEEEYASRLDGYFNVVINEWADDNHLAIESGLRNQIAENFIEGLKNLFVENYIDVPNERYDVMSELDETIQKMESKLSEQIEKNIDLFAELNEAKKTVVFLESTQGLTDTEVDKFAKMTSDIDFVNEKQYARKLNLIRENYFKTASPSNTLNENMNYADINATDQDVPDGIMGLYAKTLDRFNGKRE